MSRIWCAAALMLCAGFSYGGTLSVGSGFAPQTELMQGPGEYFAASYVAGASETVLITGFWENTDQYRVFVDGSLLFVTPAISGPAIDYGDRYGTYQDPAAAYSSGLFSAGEFTVAANDVITIQDIGPLFPDPAQGAGEFDAQVALDAVPEPAAAGLIAIAVLLMLCSRRFSLRKSSAVMLTR